MAAGPAAFVCWSMNPMAIVEFGFIRPANSRPALLASLRGRPCCTNWMRGVPKLNSPPKFGDGTEAPLRLLLPCSHRATELRLVSESLRRWKSTSLDSICTLTLNRSLVTPGTGAPGPPTKPFTTSVGDGAASSSAGRLGLDSSVGMCDLTRARESRLKYGTP